LLLRIIAENLRTTSHQLWPLSYHASGRFQEDVMNLHRNALATLLVAAGLSSPVGGAYAGPLNASISLRDAIPQAVETVQWRGGGWRGGWGGGWRGGWGGGWRGGWGGWRGGWGGWRGGWGGVGLGLATGAIISGALAAPYYGGYGYYSSPYYGDDYDYGYSPAYYGDYAPTYGYGRSIYGGYWPGYRPRVFIVHRPFWRSW
jgi:hypothetical protein